MRKTYAENGSSLLNTFALMRSPAMSESVNPYSASCVAGFGANSTMWSSNVCRPTSVVDDTAINRAELALGDGFREIRVYVFFGKRAVGKIFFHQGVVGFGDDLDQAFACGIKQLFAFRRDGDAFRVSIGIEFVCLLMYDIDDAA